MSGEETAVSTPQPGLYRHFKGNNYYVIGVAQHSETDEALVVYRPLYGDGGLRVRPVAMFVEHVERDGYAGPRFVYQAPHTDLHARPAGPGELRAVRDLWELQDMVNRAIETDGVQHKHFLLLSMARILGLDAEALAAAYGQGIAP
jgi:hypothetical protein